MRRNIERKILRDPAGEGSVVPPEGGGLGRQDLIAEITTTSNSRHSKGMRTIHAFFQSDGGWFIARCLDLPVTTQWKTLAVAKKNLQEAVELYLETWGDKNRKTAKEVYLTSMEVAA